VKKQGAGALAGWSAVGRLSRWIKPAGLVPALLGCRTGQCSAVVEKVQCRPVVGRKR
jgi:hypothetical protein